MQYSIESTLLNIRFRGLSCRCSYWPEGLIRVVCRLLENSHISVSVEPVPTTNLPFAIASDLAALNPYRQIHSCESRLEFLTYVNQTCFSSLPFHNVAPNTA